MKTIIISISISVLLSVGISWGVSSFKKDKVAFIKSAIILRDYKGMVAATDQYNQELKVVQANLDTLQNRFESIKRLEETITAKEHGNWSYRLGVAQTEYQSYNEQASQQMQVRRDELTNSVLQTINNFIESYGTEHHYKLIFGATENGSILFGTDGDDLTQIVLDELNKMYDKNESGE